MTSWKAKKKFVDRNIEAESDYVWQLGPHLNWITCYYGNDNNKNPKIKSGFIRFEPV